MAQVHVMPDEEFERLRSMLEHGVVLVPQSVFIDAAIELNVPIEQLRTAFDKEASTYDFDGGVDVQVDFVDSTEHYFVQVQKQKQED